MNRSAIIITLRLISFVSGVACLLFSLYFSAQLIYFKRVTGTIHYRPVLTRDGTVILPSVLYIHGGGLYGFDPPPKAGTNRYNEGDSVTVLYDPAGTSAIIETPTRWVRVILIALSGVILAVASRLPGHGKKAMDGDCGHKIWVQNILLLSFTTLSLTCLTGIYEALRFISGTVAIENHTGHEDYFRDFVDAAIYYTGFSAFCGFGLGFSALAVYQLLKKRWTEQKTSLAVPNSL